MAQKQIVWSAHAEKEFALILEYYTIRNGNSKYSLKLVHEVGKLITLLPKNNYLGKLSDNGFTRVLVKKEFLILYEIYQNAIVIVSFFDGRQDSSKRMDVDKKV